VAPGALSAKELLVRGKLHLGARRFRAAAEDFRHAARLDPQAAPAWLGLARALALLPSEQREALDALERAIARGVRDPAMIRRAVEGTALEEDYRFAKILRGLTG
jgi:cytochrome c-type biogenesis protein CcmH/NrfG